MLLFEEQQHKGADIVRLANTEANRTGATRPSTSRGDIDPHSSLPWEPPGTADITAEGPAQLPNDLLESEIVELVARLSSATYDLLRLIGELDDRGTYALSGALSCAAWLADRCDIERVTAHNQVRVARAMRTYPVLDAAMAAGDVSYAKARMLVPHLSVEHAEELVRLAATTPTSGLATAIACWSHRNESQDDIDARHHRERCLWWRTEPDGMVRITALLAPVDAAAVCAVIDKTVTVTPMGVGNDAAVPCPTLGQQRADALVVVVTKSDIADHSHAGEYADIEAGATSDTDARNLKSRVDTEIVVHVTEDGNSLADGTPLTEHAVTRMLPEAFVSLLLLDNRRQPIDASPRRRFPTRRQRRVVDARQDECQHPGCHARALLQYDHKQPYPLGGTTTIDNLQRLCGPHNRAKYDAEIGQENHQ
jgi:hypothetical protein